jgi:hypothetical protein
MSFRYKQSSSDALNTFLFLNKHEGKVYDWYFFLFFFFSLLSKHVTLYLLQSLITHILDKTKILFTIFDILLISVFFYFVLLSPDLYDLVEQLRCFNTTNIQANSIHGLGVVFFHT